MKAYICDQCQTQAEPDQYDLSPKGWITMTPRDDAKQYHYCGNRCLRAAAEARCARDANLADVQNISPSIPPDPPAPTPIYMTGEGRTDDEAVAVASERQEL